MSEGVFLVGALAKAAGTTADTIRFYERNGLMPEPARSAAGYRLYDQEALRRLLFIRRAQEIGFSLAEIQRILDLQGSGSKTCECVIESAKSTLADTERKIARLSRLRDSLRQHLERWKSDPSCGDASAEFCSLIENADPIASRDADRS